MQINLIDFEPTEFPFFSRAADLAKAYRFSDVRVGFNSHLSLEHEKPQVHWTSLMQDNGKSKNVFVKAEDGLHEPDDELDTCAEIGLILAKEAGANLIVEMKDKKMAVSSKEIEEAFAANQDDALKELVGKVTRSYHKQMRGVQTAGS